MAKYGRPITQKTAATRQAIKDMFAAMPFNDRNGKYTPTISTVDVALLTDKPKTAVIFALRYFEENGYIERDLHAARDGTVGQPPKRWKANRKILGWELD